MTRYSPILPDRPVGAADSGIIAPPAGLAGLDSGAAHQRWPEELRHSVKTPGGYEWWYFHAISPAGDGILITLFEGLPFHPTYLTQLNRHAHRIAASPYDKMRPELSPSHYPAAYMAVYQAGKKVAQFLNVYPPDTSSGESETPEIRIGPNRITLRQDGSLGVQARGYPFEMSHGRPRAKTHQNLTAQLTFTPSFPATHARALRKANADGATHHWVITAPHARVTGNVQLIDTSENIAMLDLRLDCVGYHDHVYGHGGLASGIQKLMWGFLQGEDWTAAWHQTEVKGEANDRALGLVFFEKDHKPVVVESPSSLQERGHLSSWFMRHPGRITMHGSDTQGHPVEMILSNDATLDTAPFHTRLTSAGSVTIPGRGSFAGHGATHILKLRRLQWPIFSDLTLMALTHVPKDDPLWRQ